MEQVQRRFITFNVATLDIQSISWDQKTLSECACLPIRDNSLADPFFDLTRRINEYYPIIEDNTVIGFRRRGIYENQLVLETEEDILRGLRSYENFITKCRIMCSLSDSGITLRYDSNFFNSLDNQENFDRLKLSDKSLYNIYITRKGDPFTIYGSSETSLVPFTNNETVFIPYTGQKDISVYVVTKN
jgi:hypothetical protein